MQETDTLLMGGKGKEKESDKPQKVGCLSKGQGSMQAVIRPAMWFPGLRALHHYGETWLLGDTEPANGAQTLADGVKKMRHEDYIFELHTLKIKQSSAYVEIHCWTKARWLDIVEITFKKSQKQQQSIATARAFSTGIFPMTVPAAPLFNCLLFFMPFSDNDFLETVWLEEIKKASSLSIEIEEKGRKC